MRQAARAVPRRYAGHGSLGYRVPAITLTCRRRELHTIATCRFCEIEQLVCRLDHLRAILELVATIVLTDADTDRHRQDIFVVLEAARLGNQSDGFGGRDRRSEIDAAQNARKLLATIASKHVVATTVTLNGTRSTWSPAG